MKKFYSILLVLVLIFTLSPVVYASSEYSTEDLLNCINQEVQYPSYSFGLMRKKNVVLADAHEYMTRSYGNYTLLESGSNITITNKNLSKYDCEIFYVYMSHFRLCLDKEELKAISSSAKGLNLHERNVFIQNDYCYYVGDNGYEKPEEICALAEYNLYDGNSVTVKFEDLFDVNEDSVYKIEFGVRNTKTGAEVSVDYIYVYNDELLKETISNKNYTEDFVVEEPSFWAEAEIKLAKSKNLITPDTVGKYQHITTRQQFASLIVNLVETVLSKEIVSTSDSFSDCNDVNVLKAYSAGIINGVGNNKFLPDAYTNREQIATMLYRAVKYIEKESGKEVVVPEGVSDGFEDAEDISSWAYDCISILANNNIINGIGGNCIGPKNNCSVEQSILFVYRLFVKANFSLYNN